VNAWAPAGVRAVALQRAMSCSPCFLERPSDCQRDLVCLTALTAGEVFDECIRMLGYRMPADRRLRRMNMAADIRGSHCRA